ncbi:MAG: cyclic nucleotide-binding domain-containing protein, partial [Chloroflexota bacterium]
MIKELHEVTNLVLDTTLFSSMDDEALKGMVGLFKLRSFSAGEPLYRVADQTDGFYLILEGEAAIVDEKKAHLEEKMILIKGDFVGEEAILGTPSRSNTVVIKTPARMLFLENHHISHLLEAYPEIKTNIKIMLESRQLLQRLKMPWLREDEYTHVIVRKHPALLIASAFVPIVFFLAIL